MKALVFGGTRFMGKHLVEALISQGHDVTIATRGLTPDDFGDRVKRLIVDRTDSEKLKQTIPSVTYDAVFDSLAYCSNEVKIALEAVKCKKYLQISSASVYHDLHIDTNEEEFNPLDEKLVFCNRLDFDYDEVKRQAEIAITQVFGSIPSVMLRCSYVIGEDDYTDRLYFYVEHIVNQIPMYIDTPNAEIAFVRSDEAGKFLAFLAQTDSIGSFNAASEGTITMAEVISYVESKTGKRALLSPEGEAAPYNGEKSFSLNVDKAKAAGFSFTPLSEWIYQLLDSYIARAMTGKDR